MPNWCANLLEIAGSVEEKKRFLEASVQNIEGAAAGTNPSPLSLQSLYPIPEEERDNWYNWCIENWGTKWDIDAELMNPYWEDDDENLVFKFDSAWAPPEAAFNKISGDFPKLAFSLLYAEPGVQFSGGKKWNEDALDYPEFTVTNNANVHDIIASYIWSYSNG